MKLVPTNAALSMTVTAILTLVAVSSAHAQFSLGNIQFGGGNRGVPSFQLGGRQTQNSHTDMRYRGPVEFGGSPGRGVTIGSGPVKLSIDPQRILSEGLKGADFARRNHAECVTRPCPPPCKIVHPEPNVPPSAPEPEIDPAVKLTYAAQEAFARQNYLLAIERMDRVLELSPESASAYQFRGLAHFADGDFDRAAADVYDTLLRGPIWNWETVYPLYKSKQVYTNQYRALSRAAKQDPSSMSKHFLLAYHHLMLGHLEHGEKELRTVLTIQPNETVTQKLLAVVQDLREQEANQVARR